MAFIYAEDSITIMVVQSAIILTDPYNKLAMKDLSNNQSIIFPNLEFLKNIISDRIKENNYMDLFAVGKLMKFLNSHIQSDEKSTEFAKKLLELWRPKQNKTNDDDSDDSDDFDYDRSIC